MKHNLLFCATVFALCAWIVPTNAGNIESEQRYMPMLENTRWVCMEAHWCKTPNNDKLVVYDAIRDTLLNGKVYKILRKQTLHLRLKTIATGYIFLYEDIATRKVYKYNSNSQEDELLYDFSLQIGDTMPQMKDYVLTDISYIESVGISRKKFTFSYVSEDDSWSYWYDWIEGIGNTGSFEKPSQPYGNDQTICVHKEDLVVYGGEEGTYSCQKYLDKFNDAQAQAIDQVPTSSPVTKILSNGQLLILRDGRTFNAFGVEIK